MRPFDDRFAEKVREVFDHHEEAFDPGAWASFKERLHGSTKSRRMAWLYMASKAAAALLIIGGLAWLTTFLFFSEPSGVAEKLTDKDEPGIVEPSEDLPGSTNGNPLIGDDTPGATPGDLDAAVLASGNDANTRIAFSNDHEMPMGDVETDSVRSGQAIILVEQEFSKVLPAVSGSEPPVKETTHADTISLAGLSSESSRESVNNDMHQSLDGLKEMPVNDVEKKAERRLNWDVTAGSMLTYAEQQLASGLGFAGGVLSEYRVSDWFGVSSGLVLAYQQFEVDDMPLRQRLSKAEYDYVPEQYTARTLGDQSYEFLALDIPVNVQVYIQEARKTQWFVSAGFSSLLYLQQRVSGTETAYIDAEYFEPVTNSYRTVSYTSEVQMASNYDALSRFDFARLLNVSVGYEVRREHSVAIVEPFIKYPLGPLSSRNIKMGMGGLRIRLRFGH